MSPIAARRYMSKPYPREAVRLDWGPHTGHTADEMLAFLREWSGDPDLKWDPFTHELCFVGPEHDIDFAEPGQWILKHPDGFIYAIHDSHFREAFEVDS